MRSARRALHFQRMKGRHFVATPAAYIAKLDEPRRTEIATIDAFIRKTVPKLPAFICHGMLAYGPVHYRYASGREGDWFRIGLASHARYISLYVCACNEKGCLAEQAKAELPKASIGRSCIRFKRWSDVDPNVIEVLLKEAAALPAEAYISTGETKSSSKKKTTPRSRRDAEKKPTKVLKKSAKKPGR